MSHKTCSLNHTEVLFCDHGKALKHLKTGGFGDNDSLSLSLTKFRISFRKKQIKLYFYDQIITSHLLGANQKFYDLIMLSSFMSFRHWTGLK